MVEPRRGGMDAGTAPRCNAPAVDDGSTAPELEETGDATYHFAGSVVPADGSIADQVTVELRQRGEVVAEATTDGSGWFGFVDVDPGHYQLRLDRADAIGSPPAGAHMQEGQLVQAELRTCRLG